MSWISTAYAMGAGPQAGQEGNLLASLAPFALIFLVFYFLLIRPQQKKAKEHKAMLAALKKGDAILTAGGMYGRIVDTRDDLVVVDLGETKVTMGRAYIAAAPDKKQAAPALKKEPRKGKGKPDDKTEETPAAEAVAVEAPAAEVVSGDADKDKPAVQ
jgi:preprotein translocase subunit YajC